jgi:hypothetical protein
MLDNVGLVRICSLGNTFKIMIEIFRKGFRLDIAPSQIVTFKKSQNLNGIQERYAYSNTISLEKTANNKKLLELFDLPTNKVSSLMNGYEVDIVLNGSIHLRNQTLKIQKEGLEKIDTYLLYSDNALVIKLKETFINSVARGYLYKKTVSDFLAKSVFMETQEKSGLYVIEEMPLAINLQELVEKMFTDNNYAVYGDFFNVSESFKDYFVAANTGTYQIYAGIGDGFAPTFDVALDSFAFLNQVLAFFNCYAEVDGTYKTVVINKWANLEGFKTNYIDYSNFYVNYQDYTFQSKLAKRNEMTYSDSGTLFNSFFANFISSQDKATYLSSAFGAGTLNLFEDSEILEGGLIAVRPNNEVGETSAIRIFKLSDDATTGTVYVNGSPVTVTNKRAFPVSMQTVYTEFHKAYTDFILTPLVTNIQFRYDAILATTFSLTKVFFIEQLSSYWIPLEINFSTKKDLITIKAMLVKKRKVLSPLLNDFNSIILNFKEKALFPLDFLKSMYPMPPNEYAWDIVIFKSYNQDFNRLYINDVLIPAATLPQAFSLADIVTMKVEANKPSDTQADFNSDSLYIQAIDTNGGVSNEAYINIQHTGVASLESNFYQVAPLSYSRNDFDSGSLNIMPFTYTMGLKPNLNDTITSIAPFVVGTAPDDTYNMVVASEPYTDVKVVIEPFQLYLKTQNNGIGKARAIARIIMFDGVTAIQLYEIGAADNQTINVTTPKIERVITSFPTTRKIRVYVQYFFDNRRGSNSGSMNVETTVTDAVVTISTIKAL